MRVVLDTNVLVSALIRPGSVPAQVLDSVLAGELVLLHDARILEEYRDVLSRPKFALDPVDVAVVLQVLETQGEPVPGARFQGLLPDAGDQPFADVAFTGQADALITGNTKHFQVGRSIRVVTPREWTQLRRSMKLLGEMGLDERAALEPNEPYAYAMACKRCGYIRVDEVRGLQPDARPRLLPFTCRQPGTHGPDTLCGGEVWGYDDNDLGRCNAAMLGIPVLST